MTIDYSALKDLTQKEISDKVQTGEVKIPLPGADRQKFFEFAVADSEGRKKFIDNLDTTPNPPNDKQDNGVGEKPVENNTGVEDTETKTPKEGTSSNPFSELGYESEEEAAKALKSLRKVINSQKTTIDNLNANAGKMGRELKELREHKPAFSQANDKKTDEDNQEIKKPVRPKRPDPTKFDDGTYDEKYAEAFKKYESDLDAYEEELYKYTANQKPEWYKDLTAKVEDVSSYVNNNVKQEEAQKVNSKWSKMFDEEIPSMQETYGLKTSIPIKDLSDAFKVLQDPKRSVADKQEINEYLKTVPKNDIENYKKVQNLVSKRYRFDSGVPEQNYRTWDGAISDHGLQNEYVKVGTPGNSGLTPEEKVRLEAQQKLKNEQTATVPKSSGSAAHDGKMYGNVSVEDQRTEFVQLRNEYDIACRHSIQAKAGFESSQKFKRYCDLRLKLTGSLPDGIKNTLKKVGV